eukprot:5245-Eustigmatos_ZCMA.PRE.1
MTRDLQHRTYLQKTWGRMHEPVKLCELLRTVKLEPLRMSAHCTSPCTCGKYATIYIKVGSHALTYPVGRLLFIAVSPRRK